MPASRILLLMVLLFLGVLSCSKNDDMSPPPDTGQETDNNEGNNGDDGQGTLPLPELTMDLDTLTIGNLLLKAQITGYLDTISGYGVKINNLSTELGSTIDTTYFGFETAPQFEDFSQNTMSAYLEVNGDTINSNEEVFDYRIDVVRSKRRPFPGGLRSNSLSFASDPYIYLGGGSAFNEVYYNDFYRFDINANEWTQLADLEYNIIEAATGVIGNKVYVVAGYSEDLGYLSQMRIFDLGTETWSDGPEFPGTNRTSPYHYVLDGKLYVGLGRVGLSTFEDLWRFDPATEEWEEVSGFPGTEFDFSTSTFLTKGGYGYVIARQEFEDSEVDLWRYDPVNDLWEQLSSFYDPFCLAFGPEALDFRDNYIFLRYGSYTAGPCPGYGRFWIYDISEDSWHSVYGSDFSGISDNGYWGAADTFTVGGRYFTMLGYSGGHWPKVSTRVIEYQ